MDDIMVVIFGIETILESHRDGIMFLSKPFLQRSSLLITDYKHPL